MSHPGAVHDFCWASCADRLSIGVIGFVNLDNGTNRAHLGVVECVVATIVIDGPSVEAVDDARWKDLIHIV